MTLTRQEWSDKVLSLAEKSLGDVPVAVFRDGHSVSITRAFKVNASVTVEFFVGDEAETRFRVYPSSPKHITADEASTRSFMLGMAQAVIEGMDRDICPIVLDD